MALKNGSDNANWTSKKQFAFKGFLEVVPLADIFNLLQLGSRTGCLVVSRENRSVFVYIQDGKLHCISSPNDRRKLLESVLRNTTVEDSLQEELLQSVEGKDATLPNLVELKIITKPRLTELARKFVLQEICGLFLWSRGEFEFLDQKLPPEDLPTVEIDLPFAVMEAMRNLDDIRRNIEWMVDDSAIPCLYTPPQFQEETVTLATDEWRIISYINGIYSMAEICDVASNLGDYRVYRALASLAKRKLIKKCDRDTSVSLHDAVKRSAFIPNLSEQTLHGSEYSERLGLTLEDKGQPESPKKTPKAVLMLERGGKTIREFVLNPTVTQIGRGESCDIVLKNDPTISRLHARVLQKEGDYILQDLNSANGVFVNSKKISQHILVDHDQIQVGSYIFSFSIS